MEHLEPYVYRIEDALYLNITNRCNLACEFCPRFSTYEVAGQQVQLGREGKIDDFLAMLPETPDCREIVFCGYGEPTLRLPLVLALADAIKKRFPKIPLRLNTNGLANLMYGRNILPELALRIDSVSVSLNAEDASQYAALCKSKYGQRAYPAVKNFIRQARHYIPQVTASVVALPQINRERCEEIITRELGVTFRYRPVMPVTSEA